MADTSRLRILALEPYGALSHRQFLEGLGRHSRHEVVPVVLPARKWKWRLRTAAWHYRQWTEEDARVHGVPDLLFASDFLNVGELLALLPAGLREIPAVLYFHENQLTYPLQETESLDYHFPVTHVNGVLACAWSFFNSAFHRREFLGALPEFLRRVPDIDVSWIVPEIERRSSVLPLGVELDPRMPDGGPRSGSTPLILWNHRWEYDKAPEAFVAAIRELVASGEDFRLRVLGERFREVPAAFQELETVAGERLESSDFLPDREAYQAAVRGADIVVSTAIHEFFGLGTLEALRSGLHPVLPDDLAYPELLPARLRSPRFLYPRAEGITDTLRDALTTVREGRHLEERRHLVTDTDRFAWDQVAPRYDDAFEAVVRGEVPDHS